MSYPEWLDWQMFYEMGLFGEKRADWRTASVLWMLASIHAEKGKTFEMADFLLKFGAEPPADEIENKVRQFFRG